MADLKSFNDTKLFILSGTRSQIFGGKNTKDSNSPDLTSLRKKFTWSIHCRLMYHLMVTLPSLVHEKGNLCLYMTQSLQITYFDYVSRQCHLFLEAVHKIDCHGKLYVNTFHVIY